MRFGRQWLPRLTVPECSAPPLRQAAQAMREGIA